MMGSEDGKKFLARGLELKPTPKYLDKKKL